MSELNKKQFWIALLINFFFPGGGHIYAGKSDKGVWILVGNIVCWGLVPVIYVTIIGVIGTWLYSLFTTKDVVDEYNKKIDSQVEKKKKEERKRIDVENVVDKIDKAKRLFKAEIISKEEFSDRKSSIINELAYKKLADNPDDLLIAIAPMKKSGDITDEEIKMIKKYILT